MKKKIMLTENHVMQVLYKKSYYARTFIRKMYMKSCYGNLFETAKNIMFWEIMLWKDHVRQGLAVV